MQNSTLTCTFPTLLPFTFLRLVVLCALKRRTGRGPPIDSAYLPLKASLNFMFISGSRSPAVFLPLVSAHKRHWGCKDVQLLDRHTHLYMNIRCCYVPAGTYMAGFKKVCKTYWHKTCHRWSMERIYLNTIICHNTFIDSKQFTVPMVTEWSGQNVYRPRPHLMWLLTVSANAH